MIAEGLNCMHAEHCESLLFLKKSLL